MIRWYSTLNGDNGLLNYQTPTKDSLIVCHQGKEFRKFGMFNYHYLFGNYLLKQPAEERCYFEVIRGTCPQKPYFDIDIKDESVSEEQSMSLIRSIKKSILYDSRIAEPDILVFSSHGPGKLSYHVVVNNWCLPDYNSNKVYCTKIIDRVSNPYKDYIDGLVYKSIQQFRTYGSTKRGKDRFKKLVGYETLPINSSGYRFEFLSILLKSLVSNTNSCRILEYSEPTKRVFSGPSEALTEKEMDIIKNLPFIISGDFEIVDVKDRLISLKRLKPSFCELCKREHQNENPYLIVTGGKTSVNKQIHFHCRRIKNDRFVIWEGQLFDPKISPARSAIESLTPTGTPEKVKTDKFIKKFLGKK